MLDQLQRIPLWELSESKVASTLSNSCQTERERHLNNKYLAIFYVNELNRSFLLIAHCGLQKDIRNQIAEGKLSFNKFWLEELDLRQPTCKISIASLETPVARQLDVIFKNHKILEYKISSVKCTYHEYVLFIEANKMIKLPEFFGDIADREIVKIAQLIHLSHLRSYKDSHISDWEKAVHELASPLDFIYSNSDFLIRYLKGKEISEEQKTLKLEDFKTISDLLIKRLHTYRFAFAETINYMSNLAELSLFNLFMPITHLWYHEARQKNIKFIYEELKDIKIVSDAEAIQFIAFNLISNAIKYSNKNTIINIYAKTAEDNFKFGVSNIGLPISEEEYSKIFDLGYRSKNAMDFDSRGLGVGLHVCRSLTNELGGKIRVTNNTGNPTTFEVELPDWKRKT